MQTAYATIKGFEVMRALKKRQASGFNFSGGIKGEIRIVKRAFGLGNCVMADMMNELEICLKGPFPPKLHKRTNFMRVVIFV